MKYKVGDKVKIRSLEWYNENKDSLGCIIVDEEIFNDDMSKFCGKEAEIGYVSCSNGTYYIDLDDWKNEWTDEMFEEPSNCAMGINKPSYKLNVKNMEQKKTFEPFERILVKGKGKEHFWYCAIFSHETDTFVFTIGESVYDKKNYDFIPFADNEHLVGTNEMPCEEVEISKGELCAMFCDEYDIHNCIADIRSFGRYDSSYVYDTGDVVYGYCVKLSQFNHNDMEETRKHILCVKNGKLVRARV